MFSLSVFGEELLHILAYGRVCSIAACAAFGRVCLTAALAASGRVYPTEAIAASGRVCPTAAYTASRLICSKAYSVLPLGMSIIKQLSVVHLDLRISPRIFEKKL